MILKTMTVTIPLNIEQGYAGLFYVTCPLIKGLMVALPSQEEAIAAIPHAINALASAYRVEAEGKD